MGTVINNIGRASYKILENFICFIFPIFNWTMKTQAKLSFAPLAIHRATETSQQIEKTTTQNFLPVSYKIHCKENQGRNKTTILELAWRGNYADKPGKWS